MTAILILASCLAPPAGSGEKPGSDWDRYIERAATLKKFHENGALHEGDVLEVLRKAGVFKTIGDESGGEGHRSFAAGFRPFKVRVYRGLWRWPLRAGVVSSEFGYRFPPDQGSQRGGRGSRKKRSKKKQRHHGIDIAADEGDPVVAAAPGKVLYSGDALRGYGNVVILRHDEKTTSLYAHNERLLVEEGDRVRGGQRIATVGSTGRSTGPHLHFEVRRKKKALNPRKILPKSRF